MNATPSGVEPRHARRCPVFVIGHSRSGTSLMCRLLRDHFRIGFGTESQFIVRYHQRLARYGDLRDPRRLRSLFLDISRERFFARTRHNFGFVFDVDAAMSSVGEASYAGALRAIFEQYAASQAMERWGDKTPEYCRHLPLIRSLFPDTQFVHVVRDGRDVANSSFKTGFGPKNAYEAALDWRRTLDDIARFRATLPSSDVTEVRYEDLLSDPHGTMATLAAFVGIENHGEVAAATAPYLRADVRENNAFKWRQQLTWREVECFEAFAGDALTAHGYPLQFRARHRRQGAGERLFWQTQAAWRRFGNRGYWSDNWYKLRLRLQDAAAELRAVRHSVAAAGRAGDYRTSK